MPGPSRADRVLPRRIGSFPGRAMVLHIGEGRPRGSIRGFPRDSGTITRMSVFSARAPMCRAGPSAHGRISTALNAEAFPHDYADPSLAGPGRMCSTARHRPDTAHPGPTAPPRRRGSAPAPHPPSRTIARFPAAPGILSRRKGSLRHFGMGGAASGGVRSARQPPFWAAGPPVASPRPRPRRGEPRAAFDRIVETPRVRACGGANGVEPGISGGNPPGRGGRRAQ